MVFNDKSIGRNSGKNFGLPPVFSTTFSMIFGPLRDRKAV